MADVNFFMFLLIICSVKSAPYDKMTTEEIAETAFTETTPSDSTTTDASIQNEVDGMWNDRTDSYYYGDGKNTVENIENYNEEIEVETTISPEKVWERSEILVASTTEREQVSTITDFNDIQPTIVASNVEEFEHNDTKSFDMLETNTKEIASSTKIDENSTTMSQLKSETSEQTSMKTTEQFATTLSSQVESKSIKSSNTNDSTDEMKSRTMQQLKKMLKAHILRGLLTDLNESRKRQLAHVQESQGQESNIHEEFYPSWTASAGSFCDCSRDDNTSNDSKIISFNDKSNKYSHIDRKNYPLTNQKVISQSHHVILFAFEKLKIGELIPFF